MGFDGAIIGPRSFEDCDECKAKFMAGRPVSPIFGAKILSGGIDTDFTLESAFPIVWARSYASDSIIGTPESPVAWFGQGWDNPYGMQIQVYPALDKIEILLPLGQKITFPLMEAGDEIFSIQRNFTLIREAEEEEEELTSFKFRIAIGTSEAASNFYEFHFQTNHPNIDNCQSVLCTGVYNLYQNRIGFEYLNKNAKFKLYPSHIYDAIDRVIALNFKEIDSNIRLQDVKLLRGLPIWDKSDALNHNIANSIEERLKHAQHQAQQQFLDVDDYLNAKTLAHYKYSKDADLIEVYVDDSDVDAENSSEYKLKLSRKFEWKNHIMTAHHEVGGVSSYYEYSEYLPTGKVIRHWTNVGEKYEFKYGLNFSDVIYAPETPLEKSERYYFNDKKFVTRIIDALGAETKNEYNASNQLIRTINADGGITEYDYDGAELSSIRSLIQYDDTTKLPIWREISLQWEYGRLVEVIDPLGNSEQTEYDLMGQPIVITDALGHQTTLKYSPNGNVYQVTDAKGGHKRMLWDDFGNLLKYQDCSGKQTQYSYDAYNRISKVTNALGHETTFKYYAHQQQPIEISYPDKSVETFKYDALERLIEYRDALGRTTSYEYSLDSLPIRRIDPANGVVSYQYDALRRFVGLTNENGKTWTFEYDANDQVIAETTFDGVRTDYQYSPAGQLIKHRQFTDHKEVRYSTIFKRDLLGQLLEQYIVDHHDLTEKKRIRYDYDLAGQLLQARNADSHVNLSYDEIGQLKKEQLIAHWFNEATQEHSQRSHRLTHLYDELGNRIETKLPDGRKLKTMYYGSGHAWNYALEDSDGTHEISSLERDDLHQEIARSQGHLRSQFKLDRMGRLTEQSVAWENTPTQKRLERLYDYDKAGQLKEILDKRYLQQTSSSNNSLVVGGDSTQSWQRKQTYQYDVLSRLTGSELSSQGQNDNYLQIREQFAFDPASNILPIASAQENSKTKIEDNRVRHIEQEHQTVDYNYDDLGRIVQKRIQIKDKNAFGHIQQQHLNQNHLLNQFSTRQIDLQWDEQNQLKASTSTKPDGRGGQEIIETQYCYDPFGRRIAKQSQIYKKELITQQIKAKTRPHLVDDQSSTIQTNNSNQLGSSMNLSLGGNTLSSSSTPRSNTVIRPAETISKEQLKLVQSHALWNVWDGNRILQDYNGKHVFTTVYEADVFVPLARLVWKDEPNQDSSNLDEIPQNSATKLAELKESMLKHIEEDEESEGLDGLEGLKELKSINELDQENLIAFPKPNKPTKQHSTHEIYWYQNDHLGTPRELTQHNGDIAWEAVYQAWGSTVTVEWQEVANAQELNPIQLNVAEHAFLLQPHRFQGQIYDVETGLHYNRFRYYDPDAGRFINHDPIGLLGGDNQFQYAINPVSWIDPLGLLVTPNIVFDSVNSSRVSSLSATITKADLNTGTGTNKSSSNKAKKDAGCSDVDAGHLLAKKLGGSGGVNGTFAQNRKLNRGRYRVFEGQIAKAVINTGSAKININFVYKDKDTLVPRAIIYSYVDGNGKKHSQTFFNSCCGKV